MKWAMAWFGVVAACTVLGGCKSDDDAAAISQNDLPSAKASVYCESLGDCCASAKLVFDSTNCKAAATARQKASLNDAVTAAVRYDAQAAGDCVAELRRAMKCGRTQGADQAPACDRILTGTRAAGEPCSNSWECAGSGYCNDDSNLAERVCTVSSVGTTKLVHGKAGEPCVAECFDAESCSVPTEDLLGESTATPVACYRDDSLYCEGTCQKLKAIGEICDDARVCKEGLFCAFDSGICTAPHPNGAACQGDLECQSNNCEFEVTTSGRGKCMDISVTAEECANGTL